MKKLIYISIVLVTLLLLISQGFAYIPANSFTFKGNFQRTGYTDALIKNNSVKAWTIENIPNLKEINFINNSLVAVTKKCEIISINESTKECLWIYKTYSEITSSPTYYDSRLYFGTAEGRIICLDFASGKELWSYPISGSIYTSPLILGNSLIFGSDNGKLYSLDRISGGKLWEYKTGGALKSSPATCGKYIYFGSTSGIFYCLTQSGSLRWAFNTPETIVSTPALIENYLIFTTYEGSIYCLNLDGKLIWKKLISPYTQSSPVAYDGIVYQNFSDGKLYAFNLKNGSILWFSELQKSNSTPEITKDLLIYESSLKWLNLIDRNSGKLKRQYEELLEGIIDFTVSDNSIFVLTGYSTIIKYDTF